MEEHRLGKGRVLGLLPSEDLADVSHPAFGVVAEVLGKMKVPPDFQADQDLRYIHKRDGDADIYFVANGQPAAVEAACTFRVSGKTPEILGCRDRRNAPRVGLPASEPVHDRAAAVRAWRVALSSPYSSEPFTLIA